MSETTNLEDAAIPAAGEYLVGIRLREPLLPEDYLTEETGLHVGDLVLVELTGGSVVGEVRRPQRPRPEFKRDRLYRRVLRHATTAEGEEWRDGRGREV